MGSEAEPEVPAGVICHAPKGQTIAGVARDHFRGHVLLQALSSRLNSPVIARLDSAIHLF
jgi:hypothetical protein